MPPGLFATLARVLAGPASKQADPSTSSPKEQPPSGGVPGIGAIVANRYRLEAELGRGGAGVVYRAHDLVNDREVAVKVLNLRANAIAREQFSREATLSGQLSHPHIIGVYETGFVESDNPRSAPFIAMELNRGTSLDRLQNLSYSQIINIAVQICEALEYAHARGLVHRDLKPQNILVEKRGFAYTVKLADFGLARANNERQTAAAGTVYYLAPEVIAGQPAGVAADLYSLGVVLYEMVTGRVPFSNYDEESILAQHLNEQVVPPGRTRVDVPPDLEAIILRLLAKNPEERFASARVLREALEQITLSPGASLQGNLPEAPRDNSGLELEVESVKHLLEDKRIVSVTGSAEEERTRLVL
ncbi:MAG TPA: serine/threonine-protein kinase, partial [Anaerolineae bacterium]